jgi:ribosomal protein S12 methylthiotransferase accessory factor
MKATVSERRQHLQEPRGTRKCFLRGTHRLLAPEETEQRLRVLMPILGITRVADVTGLDTIGIPVVMVIRPNARSLSVSQGKGLDLAAARASGLMEAIELYHAERIQLPLKLATYNELRFTHRMVDVQGLPQLRGSSFHPSLRTLWIEGRSLFDAGTMWVPYEMVHMDYTLPLPPGSGSFLMSSNGLASGNHLLEAMSHGLCEVIERDCFTLFRYSPGHAQGSARVDLSTVDDPVCRELLDRYELAGVEVGVWDITSDVGVAAFRCMIVDRAQDPYRPLGPAGGVGCHPSRAVALARALTEAAQSRLTIISGTRDDIGHHGLMLGAKAIEAAQRTRLKLAEERGARNFRQVSDFQGATFEEDVDHLLERLHTAGLREAIVVELTKPIFRIPVVRVLVPGLEPRGDIPGYVPGARACRRMEERAS